MMTTTLANRWILITGASSGIGAAAAGVFGMQGAHLVLGARRVEKLAAAAEDARRAGAASVHDRPLDVGPMASVESFVTWVRTLTDRVDVLINNAGGAHGLDPVATARDIAETLAWVATRPAHVCIDEVLIKPTDQAAIHKVHRRSAQNGH
jgi:NADP-dependent 3-hydroxy acid dehydrogenase YdfG